MGGHGEVYLKMNSGFTRTPLLNSKHFEQGIQRFGQRIDRFWLYWNDIYHTLLNMPRYRFIAIFFAVYVSEYVVFALLYLAMPDYCIEGVKQFSQALWFSVQTSATIGYGGRLAPDPDCASINVLVMFQVISSALVNYCMMGVVFARFSAPYKRSETVRFSKRAVVNRHSSGYMCLSLQVANVRKHTLLKPQVEMLLSIPDSASQSTCIIRDMEIEDTRSSMANLKLGLPALITHVIRPTSPLYRLSLHDMEARGMEIIVFLDGTDAMTSNEMSARTYYGSGSICLNQRFVTMYVRARPDQRVGVDMSEFDSTVSLDFSDLAGTQAPVTGPNFIKTFESMAADAANVSAELRHANVADESALAAVCHLPLSSSAVMGGHSVLQLGPLAPPPAAAHAMMEMRSSSPLRTKPFVDGDALQSLVEAVLRDPSSSAALRARAVALKRTS